MAAMSDALLALPYALVLHAMNFVPFVVVGVLLVHLNLRHARQMMPTVDAPIAQLP
jgi:hypothetical protein